MRRLRLASWAEGATLLALLLVAVPLKRLAGWPEAVSVVGPLHGAAFVVYSLMVLQQALAGRLNSGDTLRLLGAALVPLGFLMVSGVFRRRWGCND